MWFSGSLDQRCGSCQETGALPPEGLITGRAVPTALSTEARVPLGAEGQGDQGARTPSATIERVHVVCTYMRKVRGEKGPCKECPAKVDDPHYGPGQQMCRGLAEEIMSIVIRGTPYPPTGKRPLPPPKAATP